ncbi:MAG: hypothetical protein R3D52_15375 [Xanthobacteraceae bacterium]
MGGRAVSLASTRAILPPSRWKPKGQEVPRRWSTAAFDPEERKKLHSEISDKVRSITGMSCVVELVPPRTLPRTSSGKLSRAKAKKLYLSGEIAPLQMAA